MAKRKFEDGQTVIFNEKTPSWYLSSFGIQPGTEGTIVSKSYSQDYNVSYKRNGNTATINVQVGFLSETTQKSTVEKLQEQITVAQEKIAKTHLFIAENNAKIAFIKETGSETFDENEYKAYQTLTLIENSEMSKMDKARAIAALISNK
jgi:hypothetical protein